MLANALSHRVDAISESLTPPGQRPPFTRKKSARETMLWWLQHRYDQTGLALYNSMDPTQQAQLDAWLAQVVNHPAVQAMQQVAEPSPGSILGPAMATERRSSGPPANDAALGAF